MCYDVLLRLALEASGWKNLVRMFGAVFDGEILLTLKK
jgi:hypothetical protein